MKLEPKKLTPEELRLQFVNESLKRYSTTGKEANKHYEKIKKIFVCMTNSDCILELERFLTHENPAVKCNAAYALLPFAREKAEEVLQKLADAKMTTPADWHVSREAKGILAMWRKKELTFPHYKM